MATFTNFLPTTNQTDVAKTTILSFTIVDGYYGTQINTLNVLLDGYAPIINGAFANGYAGRIYSKDDGYLVGIYPKSPLFIRGAAKIRAQMNVLDAYDTMDAYDYYFYTAGYGPTPPTPDPTPENVACSKVKPFFPPTDLGLMIAIDKGTGTEAQLQWKTAYPSVVTNEVYYNIYYSNQHDEVYNNLEFLATGTDITIGGIAPAETHFFGVRATEINPDYATYIGMRQAGTDFYFYPTTETDVYVNASVLTIPALTDGFPEYGVIHLGVELARYSSLTPTQFNIATRGWGGYVATSHITGTTITLYEGKEEVNTISAQATPTFQKPNYSLTWEKGDGYGFDGYRDGYDGYGTITDTYRYKQETIDSVTTDGTRNDDSGNFNRFPHCGTYYTLTPQSFMQGQCINSYFGGVQRKDGYNVKVTSVQTHLLQREETLLETTGEPFALLRRLWTGMRCLCYMNRREHPDARCPLCFVPGTLVRAERGLIPIEQIKIGERVLSHDGSYRVITEVMERQYDGYLNSITSSVSAGPLLTTPEHPFLALHSNHGLNTRKCGPKCDGFINRENGEPRSNPTPRLIKSGNWWARVTNLEGNRISLGTFAIYEDAIQVIKDYKLNNKSAEIVHELDWAEAKDIKEGDWLVSKWNNTTRDIDFVEIPQIFRKNTNLGLKRNGPTGFVVDEEFLWIIGLYIAEGSHSKRHISFSLNSSEKEFQNKVISFFKKHGYNSAIRKSSENGITIEIYSTTLAQWFPVWLGQLCDVKHIPEEFMSLPKNKIWALISGIYDGDGSKTAHQIGQTSKILALQIAELLHKIGEQPIIRIQKCNTLTPKGNKRKTCYVVSWEEDTFTHTNRKSRWKFKNEILSQVKATDQIYYSGKVYNLEVEGTHTYVVEGIVVHNCFSTGFTSGFQQMFNPRRSDRRILVRVDVSTDDLNIVDKGGFEPAYEPTAWTLPFPSIKDRDVLVRFTPDGMEEFRYEVLSVDRNRTLFANVGAQKMKLKRLPKTDIVYQYPVVRYPAPYPVVLTTSTASAAGIPAHSHTIVAPTGADLTLYNGGTQVSGNHNHIIYKGVIQNILGHTHTII